MNSSNKRTFEIIEDIPAQVSDTDVIILLYKRDINWQYVRMLKESYDFNDAELAKLLNVSEKTFRSYKKSDHTIDQNIKESILLLLSLANHGKKLFSSAENFGKWLRGKNFYFDDKSPFDFLNTVSGIRYVDDRLTAMEYGDNV